MAGPKGGAPRRSHTKSRGGCTECKKRHLRCDETFPQCTNCTKHRTRCPYNETDREQPDMLWTDQVSHEIDLWRQEGVFPFPNLVLESIPNPAEYTIEELRLVHYVLALYDGLTKNAVAGLTVWAQYIPHILSLGATHKHVMHALMSFSASNMANKTNCPLVGQLSLDCKGLAMAGIREAVLSGNPDDVCEAIAMTSLILSWRADDWSSWYTMMKGILEASRAIVHGPRPCRLEDFLSKEYDFLAMLPELSAADRRSRTPLPEALAEWKEAQTNAQKIMEQLKQRKKPTKLIKQLLDLLDGVGKVPSYRSADDQFHRLRNLRTWVFWTPATTLDGPEPPTTDELVAIAYYYTTAILAHSLCPEINTVQLANLSVDPIRRIGEIVNQLNIQHNGEYSLQVDQLRYPLAVMRAFLSRMNLEDGQSFHGSDDFIANVSPIPHFLGVPPSSGVPHSPSLSVPHAVTHNSPATPVFSVAASHSPVSVYTGFDVSPVTPVMSAFSQTTHGYESSPMTQTTHGYGSPFSPGYAAYIDSPVSGGAHSYTDSPMSNEHLGHSHQRSFDNSPLFGGFPDFGNSPVTAGFPPIDTTPYLVNISGPGNSPQSPLFYDAGLAYSNPTPCDPLWDSYQPY